MGVNSCEEFLAVLQKSALLDKARLDEARRLVEGVGEPAAAARKLVQQNLLSRWQAQQLLSGRHTLLISKYRLLDLLGNDAVGPSYLAEHKQMDRRVVLKALARREGNSSAAVEKFLSETATLATLDHRHLSHIYDVDHEGDFYYLVMEHVQGRNLQQVVDADGALAGEAAAGLIALAADAVGHAHGQGILHLGLRPDRLVVDGQGMLKVLDIGVARLADRESPDASAVRRREAPAYQAPEQLSGSEPPDARTDVFALGAVLYLLLTGATPPAAGSAAALDPRGKRTDVPAELAAICQKMTASRPQDRYASAAEASGALQEWLQRVEALRSTARTKAAAAKPRSGANGSGADGASPVPAPSAAVIPAAGIQLTVSRKSADQRMLMLGVGSGVALAAVIAVAALLVRGMGTNPTTPPAPVAAAPETTTQPKQGLAADGKPGLERLKPVSLSGPPEAKFLVQQDGSVLVDGQLPDGADYRAIVLSQRPTIDGVRIDVLAHTLFGQGKEQPRPAKFRLSEVRVETADDEAFTSPREVKLVEATADYSEPKTPPAHAIDGNRNTHWGADAKADEDQWAVFWFDQPLTEKGGKPHWLRVTLQQGVKGMRIYEFRISSVTGTRPEPDRETAPSTPEASDEPPALAYWRFEKPAAKRGEGGGDVGELVDTSGSGNQLVLAEGAAPAKFSTAVAVPKVRATGARNEQCLDDTQPVPSKDKTAAWGLTTKSGKMRRERNLASSKLNTWTIEASFALDQLGFSHTVLGKDGPPKAGSPAPLQLRVRGDDDRIEIEATDSTGAVRSVESKAPVVAGRWYHVAASSDGKQMRLWVDAGDGGGLELQGSARFTGALAQGPGEWSVGRGFSDGKPADDSLMRIDEVRITAASLEPPQMLMYATPAELATAKVEVKGEQVATTGGKITFHPLKILQVKGPEGVEFQPQGDGSILVQGADPEQAEYTIHAQTDLTGIRGFRLEAMADPQLPGNGPGRFVGADKAQSGNFAVSRFHVTASGRKSEPRPAVVKWSKATADVSQDKFNVATLIDADPKGGWGVGPTEGKGHYAMLHAARPLGYPQGTWLTIRIEQKIGKNLTLGRFRITAFTGEEPGEDPAAGVLATDRLANPLAKVPRRVALPALPAEGESATEETTATVELATVHSSPAAPVELSLLGGDSAFETEGSRFRLEPNFKEGSRRWKILLHAAAAEPAVVAEAAMVGSELKFRWTDRAARSALANHLRNCVLEVGVGDQRRGIVLREPVSIPKLEMGFGKPGKVLRAEIPWLPAADGVQFSIRADQTDVPKYVVAPEEAPAARGKSEITFGEAGQPLLVAAVNATLKKSFGLEVDAFYQPTAEAKRVVYFRSKLDRLKAKLSSDIARGQVLAERADGAAKPQLQKHIQDADAALKQLSGMLDMADEIDKTGGLIVQVFVEVGNYRVVLAESGGQPKSGRRPTGASSMESQKSSRGEKIAVQMSVQKGSAPCR